MSGTNGIGPLGVPVGLSSQGNDENSSLKAAFENALALAGRTVGVGGSEAPDAGLSAMWQLDPAKLIAADDAWVSFMAVSEKLQNSRLTDNEKTVLLHHLVESWRSFQEYSGPIGPQIEELVKKLG